MAPRHMLKTPKQQPSSLKKKQGMKQKPKPKTPQPTKKAVVLFGAKQTPKSAPQPKRKKLSQEIDDLISDEDFEEDIKELKKMGKRKGTFTPLKGRSKAEEVDDDAESSDDDVDDDSLDDDVLDDSDDDIEDDSDLEDDSDEDDEDESLSEEDARPTAQQQIPMRKAKKTTPVAQGAGDISPSAKGQVSAVDLKKDLENVADRDKRTLFVKNLPHRTKVKDLKNECPEAIDIRLHSKRTHAHAYIEFGKEALVQEYHKALSGKKMKNRQLVVDFVGEYSTFKTKTTWKPQPEDIDPTSLFVSGFTGNVTVQSLETIFPSAKSIDIPRTSRKSMKERPGYAFIHYADADLCRKDHEAKQGVVLDRHKLVVAFAKKKKVPTATLR